jgi:hypothetical protein
MLFWAMFVPLDRDDDEPHLSLGSAALVLQIVVIYTFAAIEKMDPVWLTERSAVYYSLQLDTFATHLGLELGRHGALTRAFTVGTIALELLGPLLAVSPIATGRLRMVAVVLFIGFHLGLGLTMRLGLFPWICAAMWLALLPRPRWRIPSLTVSRPPGTALGLVTVPVVLVAALELLAPLMRSPDPDTMTVGQKVLSLTAGMQRWAMFAPHPMPIDGWHVITGVRNGEPVNIWGTTETKPEFVAATYPDSRWLAYLFRLGGGRYSRYRPALAEHLCRKYGLDSVSVVFMAEETPAPGRPLPPPRRSPIWVDACQ